MRKIIRDIEINRACDVSGLHRHATRREVLHETSALLLCGTHKAVEMLHRAGRQIVQNDQRMLLGKAEGQGAFHPAVRASPVFRDDVPQDAGEPSIAKNLQGLAVQKAAIEHTAAAERPEEAPCMRQTADQSLRALDLTRWNAAFHAEPERNLMIEGVIADPVTLGVGLFRKLATIAQACSSGASRLWVTCRK